MARRTLLIVLLALTGAAIGVGTALAASDSVHISGPHTVKLNHRLTVTVTASPSAATRLAVYDAPASCARRTEDELARSGLTEVLNRAVSHSVKVKVKLPPAAAKGTYHACAYLFHRQFDNLVTDARASLRYVAK